MKKLFCTGHQVTLFLLTIHNTCRLFYEHPDLSIAPLRHHGSGFYLALHYYWIYYHLNGSFCKSLFKMRTVGIEMLTVFFHQITWNDVFRVTYVFCICLRAASANYNTSRLLEPFLSVCNEMLKLISRSAGTRAFKITLSEEKLITFIMPLNAESSQIHKQHHENHKWLETRARGASIWRINPWDW